MTVEPEAATSGGPGADEVAQPSAVLVANNITRSFGETRALRGCTFELRAGEVHAIVGENGSGKSTLVKIISGVLPPDSGTLTVHGTQLTRIPSPRRARGLGIGTVFQEVLVVEALTVLDNVWLGADREFRTRIDKATKRDVAREALAALMDRPIDLDQPVEQLELSDRQVVVIARALVQDPKILILDEATSSLDVSGRDRLFEVVRRLCTAGTAVVFISHRMDEIESIGDRITVLRSGVEVGDLDRHDATPSKLLQMMSAREDTADVSDRRGHSTSDRVVLSLRGAVLAPAHEPVDIDVRAGAIVGVAGLEGHGQERFLRIVAGVDRPLAGEVLRHYDGRAVQISSQTQAARHGVVYVPRDRKTEGVFEPLSILDNFSLPTIGRDATAGVVSNLRRRRRLSEYVERLSIRYGSARHRITTLSGGNQQKVIIARWLATSPQVLVLNDPTRGVDLGTKRDIYRQLDELASAGIAIVMLSTEVEEHMALMDRVLVFREGKVFAEIPAGELTREGLIGAFFGHRTAGPGGSRA